MLLAYGTLCCLILALLYVELHSHVQKLYREASSAKRMLLTGKARAMSIFIEPGIVGQMLTTQTFDFNWVAGPDGAELGDARPDHARPSQTGLLGLGLAWLRCHVGADQCSVAPQHCSLATEYCFAVTRLTIISL